MGWTSVRQRRTIATIEMVFAKIPKVATHVLVLPARLAMDSIAQTTMSANWRQIIATRMPLALTPTAATRALAMTDTMAMEENAWIRTSVRQRRTNVTIEMVFAQIS